MMTEKEAILQRHSVRNYKDQKIEAEKVSLIREKIEEDPHDPKIIQTVWGKGYRFVRGASHA